MASKLMETRFGSFFNWRKKAETSHRSLGLASDFDTHSLGLAAEPLKREQLLMAASVGEAQEDVQLSIQRAQHLAAQLAQLSTLLGTLSPALEPIFDDHRKLTVAHGSLQQQMQEARAAMDALLRRSREADAMVAQLTGEAADLRVRLEVADERRVSAETDYQLAQSELRSREAAATDLQIRLIDVTSLLSQLREDKEVSDADLQAAAAEASHLRQSIAIEIDRRSIAEADLSSMRDRLREIETALDKAQAEAAAAVQLGNSHRGDAQRLQTELEAARAEKQRLAAALADAIEAREREQRTVRATLEGARVRAESLDAMSIEHRRQLGEISEALQERDRTLREQQLRLNRLEAGLREAIEQRQTLQAAAADLEASRLTMLQRLEDSGKLIRQKDNALRRAEEQGAERQAAATAREAELLARIEALEAQRSTATLQSGQGQQELAILEGRLEAQREEARRLRAQLLTLGWSESGPGDGKGNNPSLPAGSRVRHIMDREGLRS